MEVGGTAVLHLRFRRMFELAAPAVARRIPDAVLLISLLAEGSLAIWLAAFGARWPAGNVAD